MSSAHTRMLDCERIALSGTPNARAMLRADQGSDFLAGNYSPDIPMFIQIENDHGQIVVFAQADRGGVHYLETKFDDFHVGNLLEHRSVFDEEGIGIIDTIHFSCF